VVALFAGIGGIELGFHQSGGFQTEHFCEIDSAAQAVLKARFPGVPHTADVKDLRSIPEVDVLTAGFPCQDLSMAGTKVGIEGTRSSLVNELFRLLGGRGPKPRWVVVENVPYMLHLDRGRGMRLLTRELEALGFRWAYRVVDARATGLPQRRLRVVLVASRTEDPRHVLFADEAGPPATSKDEIGRVRQQWAYGFYWTEGKRGLGWAGDAVPTIKGGSSLGIPSPPAIWVPATGEIGTPDLRDLERLQGFPEDWTEPAEGVALKKGARWRLVGNAVAVPVAEWLGSRLKAPGVTAAACKRLPRGARWPNAAYGEKGSVYVCDATAWPIEAPAAPLANFLNYPLRPLSARATRGFLSRARDGIVRFPDGFLDAVTAHLETTECPLVTV
jgi:DNA (cytosine-5)-methyltransferase 1